MSSRAIVSLGVGILAMVLIGTMTAGLALIFYIGMTIFFAVVVAVMMVITRHRESEQSENFSAPHASSPAPGEGTLRRWAGDGNAKDQGTNVMAVRAP